MSKSLTSEEKKCVRALKRTAKKYYKEHARTDLPWRKTRDPYKIMVSEIMLQQTQVDRVVPKYNAFIKKFPTVKVLADAPLGAVLEMWSGLGYNRRAKMLWEAAMQIVDEYGGSVPKSVEGLESLRGVGSYTARAVSAFAYNAPVALIETNVRTVFLHHCFAEHGAVHDSELMPLIEHAAKREESREWYAVLMDYGSYLKRTLPNPSRKSRHHTVQSKFEGSLRQVRGAILKKLKEGEVSEATLRKEIETDERYEKALRALELEGMVVKEKKKIRLP